MERVIAFVPVRGGSKSIPFKNIKALKGMPLVYWPLKALEDTPCISEIVVATDSPEIENIVKSFSFKRVNIFRRSAENASDEASTESVMLEYIRKDPRLNLNDIFMLVQATSPLTRSKHFSEGLMKYCEDEIDSLLSCVRSYRFFWNDNGTPQNYDFLNRPRRQEFKGVFMENGAFYINTVENIIKSENRLSGKIGIYEMPEYTAFEIDEPDDWIIMEKLMEKYIGSDLEEAKKIKILLTDVDGVLTDSGMYYSEKGDELKKFNTRDGMAFELLHKQGIKTGIITSEETVIVKNRSIKLKVDYLSQGKRHGGKLEAAKFICKKEGITLNEVAYIGDDINCFELLSAVGIAACPSDSSLEIKRIPNIKILSKKGGEGVVREFVETVILRNK